MLDPKSGEQMPFVSLTGDSNALPKLDLQEVDATSFKLLEGFRYVSTRSRVRITIENGQKTDLASVPFFLRWFVSTYGNHTRAAIMHDHMWREPKTGVERRTGDNDPWIADATGISRVEANTLFRDAMGERPLEISDTKRWVMWAAVTLDTLRKDLPLGLLIYVFLVLHVVLDALLVAAAFGAHWGPITGHHLFGAPYVVALLLFPAPLALLWVKSLGAGLIGSYSFEVFVLPAVITLSALVVFLAADTVLAGFQHLRRLLGNDDVAIHGPSLAKVKATILAKPTPSPSVP